MLKFFSSAVFVSTLVAFSMACSSSSTPTKTVKPPVVDSGQPEVDSGETVADADTQPDVFVQPPVDSGSDVVVHRVDAVATMPDAHVARDAAKDVKDDVVVVVKKDAGEDTGPTACQPPSGTYTYTFTTVSGVICDNTLASYTVGPVSLGSLDLAGLLPGICNVGVGSGVISNSTAAANGCSASQTFTCSDPLTGVDAGGDPESYVSITTISSNAADTKLTGTLSLTQTDETTSAHCTETYTFTADTTP